MEVGIIMKDYKESYDRLFEEYRENSMGFGVRSDLDTIRELVDKATPMKVYYSNETTVLYVPRCTNCNEYLKVDNNYCPDCGQAIDND
jgi:hypothetical protein